MTDPTYKPESTDVVPRHNESDEVHTSTLLHVLTSQQAFPTSTPLTQLEQDEQLARQLAGEGRRSRPQRRRCKYPCFESELMFQRPENNNHTPVSSHKGRARSILSSM